MYFNGKLFLKSYSPSWEVEKMPAGNSTIFFIIDLFDIFPMYLLSRNNMKPIWGSVSWKPLSSGQRLLFIIHELQV